MTLAATMMKRFNDIVAHQQLLDLVAEYGSPLVVYSEAVIRERCRVLKKAFPSSHLNYAMKANYNPALLKIVRSEGFGIDAVSPNEVELALRVGFAPEKIFYVENNMTDEDMYEAVFQGVNLVIGSLSRLEKYARHYPNTNIGIRINGDVGAAHHAKTFTAGPTSKFGIHHEFIGEALEIANQNHVTINLLQQHIGSGWLETAPFLEAVRFQETQTG